jgi:hypothetical protein
MTMTRKKPRSNKPAAAPDAPAETAAAAAVETAPEIAPDAAEATVSTADAPDAPAAADAAEPAPAPPADADADADEDEWEGGDDADDDADADAADAESDSEQGDPAAAESEQGDAPESPAVESLDSVDTETEPITRVIRVRATDKAGDRTAVWDAENPAGEVFITRHSGTHTVVMTDRIASALGQQVIEQVTDED